MPAVGLTDHGSMAGAVEFYREARGDPASVVALKGDDEIDPLLMSGIRL
jgi:hypothetical protein